MSTKSALYLVGVVQLVINCFVFSHMIPVWGWIVTIITWIVAAALAGAYVSLLAAHLFGDLADNTREIDDEEWNQSNGRTPE